MGADADLHSVGPDLGHHAFQGRAGGEGRGGVGGATASAFLGLAPRRDGLGTIEVSVRLATPSAGTVHLRDLGADGSVGDVLQGQVAGGAHHEAAAGDGLLAQLRDEQAPDVLGEVGRDPRERIPAVGEVQLRHRRGVGGLGGGHPVFHHPVEHVPLPGAGQREVGEGVVDGGSLGQSGQHRRLPQTQLRRPLSEVGARRRLHAVGL